jgi:hypothetical protein
LAIPRNPRRSAYVLWVELFRFEALGEPLLWPPLEATIRVSELSRAQTGLVLFKVDRTKQSREAIVWTCGEEKLVGGAVLAESVAKPDSPELVDVDDVAILVLHRAEVLAGYGVESVDAALVSVVRHQQGVAEWSKVLRCDGEPPRLV